MIEYVLEVIGYVLWMWIVDWVSVVVYDWMICFK